MCLGQLYDLILKAIETLASVASHTRATSTLLGDAGGGLGHGPPACDACHRIMQCKTEYKVLNLKSQFHPLLQFVNKHPASTHFNIHGTIPWCKTALFVEREPSVEFRESQEDTASPASAIIKTSTNQPSRRLRTEQAYPTDHAADVYRLLTPVQHRWERRSVCVSTEMVDLSGPAVIVGHLSRTNASIHC